jgi:serine phosphatase RsbU (regulator of sigma subunit)/tetratricopeptide (TPR) repeat protein
MKFRTAILFLFFCAFPLTLLDGQDTLMVNETLARARLVDSTAAAGYLNRAKKFIESGTYDSAIIDISNSLDLAAVNDFFLSEAQSYELLGLIYDKRSDLEGMLLNYLKASLFYNRLGLFENEAKVIKVLGDRYYDLGAYRRSAGYYEQEFSLHASGNVVMRAAAAEKAGMAWYYIPDDSLSLKWFLRSSDLFASSGNTEGELRVARRLADLYIRNGEYDSARRVYGKLLSAFLGKDDYRQAAAVYNNTGFLRFRLKDYENAIHDFQSASDYSEKGGQDPWFLTDVHTNLGIACQITGRQKEMMQYFNNALVYAGRSGRNDQAARIDHILSLIYFGKDDNYHAELYCRDCITLAGKVPGDTIRKDCFMTLSRVMEKGNDYPRALEYYEKYLNIRDSLALEARLEKENEADRLVSYDRLEERLRLGIADAEIQGLEIKKLKAESISRENEVNLLLKQQELDRSRTYSLSQTLALERERSERTRKEQEVRLLEQQQSRDSLSLTLQNARASALEEKNKSLEAEKTLQEDNLKKQELLKKMGFGLGALAFIVAIMILAGLISTRRKNQKLADSKKHIEKINADLEVKNQSITDSIQYASRIQSAVLPPIDFLSEWGIENFILFRPKDIVSGDFYWGKLKDDRIIVAAADCTGHGVPGAFMSMLGHAFLDEIVNTTVVKDAAGILNLLREEIINTLKQRGLAGEARDGMDISLCIIDRKKGRMDYAGANNPLYLIREGKLTKFQADRMPIGIHVTAHSPFTNNIIEIKNGDQVYIFSDGFADQFGGPKGKKFMYKQLQDLLQRNHRSNMKQQKEILEDTFNKWRGDREQVDDVLVIGMKL